MNTKDIQSPIHSHPLSIFQPNFCPPPPPQQQQVRRPRAPSPSVVIVGGGVMGLGSALHLAEAGCTVTVLEREESVAKARHTKTSAQTAKNIQTQFPLSKLDGLQRQRRHALPLTLRLLGELQIPF